MCWLCVRLQTLNILCLIWSLWTQAAFCWWEVRWLNYDHHEGATTRNPGEEGVNFREEKDPPLAVCTSSSPSPSPSAWKYLVGLNRIFSLVLWAFELQFPPPTLPFTALFLWWNFSLLWEASSHVLAPVGPPVPPPPLPGAPSWSPSGMVQPDCSSWSTCLP